MSAVPHCGQVESASHASRSSSACSALVDPVPVVGNSDTADVYLESYAADMTELPAELPHTQS